MNDNATGDRGRRERGCHFVNSRTSRADAELDVRSAKMVAGYSQCAVQEAGWRERNHATRSISPRVPTSQNGQPPQPDLACLHPIEAQLRAAGLIDVTNYRALICKADELWSLILR